MSLRRVLPVLVLMAMIAAACSGGGSVVLDSNEATTATPEPPSEPSTAPPTSSTVAVTPAVTASAGACDPADPAACLLPWPNDRFTRPDTTTETGLRIDLPADGTPSNMDGTPIGVDEWNRNDGFSPAAMPMTVIPGLDPEASALAPVTDIGASLAADSSLILLDTGTGERVLAWAELDSSGGDPDNRALMIVPAAALTEGSEFLVALRDLVDTDGEAILPNPTYLERMAAPADQHDAATRDALVSAGLDPADMTIAWTFTVASGESISGRLRAMWAETAAEIGDGAPAFTVDSVETAGLASIVTGSFEMPNYLTGDGSTGNVFNNDGDPDGIPTRNGTMTTEFVCTVPLLASGEDPAPFVLYGHGLLGSRTQVLGIGAAGAAAGIGFCAIDFLGMSTTDVPTVIGALQELTLFRSQPDRMQQGHLGWLLMGRLLASQDGFITDAAFQDAAGVGVVAGDRLSFLGASQGGILGGASSALSSDWEQVILAVPGIGYNLLLPRSIDFDDFSPLFKESYPDPLDQALARELMEMLWDRGENAGWAQHLTTDPYDGAPAKNVLILAAFGDHQVANVSTDKLARTLDIPIFSPALADGRSTDVVPFFGLEEIPSTPYNGSGYIMWDFGTPAPPTANTPPREGEDPHGKLGDVPEALQIVAAFIEPDGPVIDVCGGGPCQTLE
jgi:hypothetical protein